MAKPTSLTRSSYRGRQLKRQFPSARVEAKILIFLTSCFAESFFVLASAHKGMAGWNAWIRNWMDPLP